MMNEPTMSPEHQQYLAELRRDKRLVHILRILFLVALIALWEIAADLEWIDPFIFSSPSRAMAMLVKLAVDGELWLHTGITLMETLVGFFLGTVLGFLVAILLWWSELARKVFDPYLVVLNSLPKIALGPVIIVWVGAGISSIITVTLLVSIVVTIIGVLNGFLEVDQEKILLMRTMGAKKGQICRKVVIPASLPTTISVLKINVGMTWVGVIVGEYLVSKAGLGYLIVYGGQVFRMDLVIGSVLLLCLLASAMYYLASLLEKVIARRMGID